MEGPMRISMRTDYALRALFTLVEHFGGGPIPIGELARRNDVPKRFLEHIMLDLKEKGVVESIAGKRGGYRLLRSPDRITMGEIVRHFDGYLAPLACVSITEYKPCSQQTTCRFRPIFLEASRSVTQLMDQTTLAGVLQRSQLSGCCQTDSAVVEGGFGDGI
ncbi:MAG: Rrf2 family transcriptional regulator [Verrucomicrobia bacterium]|nr:MAG: Rrf2 family transcriptional regulator [Verrucomicrobiota bacterium]